MKRYCLPLLSCAVFGSICMGILAEAYGSDLSDFLHSVFDEQQQRRPSGAELNYHANLTRQQGPLENYIVLCGSDEYFVNQAQRNLETYVARLHQVFLGRNPRPDELRYWVIQFQQSRVDRREMVRRFCRASGVTQLPSSLPTQPAFPVPRTAAEVASELVAQVELFVGLVQSEIGYSSYGRRVTQEAQQLFAVTRQYNQVLQSNTLTGQQLKIAADNTERSLQQLEADFHRIPGASPQSQRVLQQISQLVAAVQSAVPGGVQQPIAPTPPAANSGYTQVAALRNTARQFAYGLQAYQHQGPWYANLARDVQGLLTQIETVDLMVRQGQSRSRTRSAMQNVVKQSDRISTEMRRADVSIQQAWWNLRSQVQQTASVFGLRDRNQLEPTNPVILQRPAWSQLPYQPPVAVPSRRDRESILVADQLVASLDEYIGSLRSLPGRTAGRNPLIGSLQDLRHSVLSLRQQAASGISADAVTRASDDVMGQYQRTAAYYTRIVAANSTLNSPAFYQIGELCQKLRYAARGVRT